MNWKILLIALTLGVESSQANPFFAMDTAVRDLSELDTIKSLGYDGIGWKTGSAEEVAASVAQVRQHGLKLFAVYSDPYAVLTATGLVLDARLELAMKALEGTNAVIWLPINSEVFKASSPDGDTIAVPALQKLADTAATHGLRVAIYPHKGCWIERIQDAVRVAKAVNRKNLGVTFNLCHCLMVGDEAKIPELLAEAKPYLFLVTINGADSGKPNSDWEQLIRPLDEGTYDTGRLLRTLEKLNYSGPIGLQGYGVKLPTKENLTRSMSAWRRLNPSSEKSDGANPPPRQNP
jgi:sugar phosphate isomerase/epimerase